MAIRKRVTNSVELDQDSAIRAALRNAVLWQTNRNRHLEGDLQSGTAFDEEEVHAELGRGKALIAKWERMLALPGSLTLSNDAQA